ncbi:MAG: Gfo/Idh/MocA family protein [Opitutales bacterium]
MNLTSSRRNFIKSSSLLLGGTLLCSAQVTGANQQVRIAIVGMRSKGKDLLRRFLRLPNVKVASLCEVDSNILAQVAKQFDGQIDGATLDKDYRKVIERKDIDAVVLATPNHWHALQTIWACQAGKHVYVEKPAAHSVWEGELMVKAARKYDRIVQVGLQTRSMTSGPEIREWLKEGHLGEIKAIHAVFYKDRKSVGMRPTPLEVPSHIDYDLWLGPAEDLPIYRDSFHYDWHWEWNTGNGDLGNIGTHVADIARMYLGDPKPSCKMLTFGNRFQWNDAAQTPNMHVASFDFGGIPIILEANNFKYDAEGRRALSYSQTRRGQVVICEGGKLVGHGQGKAFDLEGKTIKKFPGTENHQKNFIDAILSGKNSDLNSEMISGHESCTLPVMAGAAYQAGKRTSSAELAAQAEEGSPYLVDAYNRYKAQCNRLGIDLEKEQWVSSGFMDYDHDTIKFTSGANLSAANGFMKRKKYREPYVVSENV